MSEVKEKQKLRQCLSGKSKTCKVFFSTTKDVRICPPCKGIDVFHDDRARAEKDEHMHNFWRKLK